MFAIRPSRPKSRSLKSYLAPRNELITAHQKRHFWEPSSKGSLRYEIRFREKVQNMTIKEQTALGWDLLKKETKLYLEELRDEYRELHKYYEEGDIDYMFLFRDQKTIDSWIVSCDSDWAEGFSQAEFIMSPHGYGLFQGYIDTTLPDDGRIKRAGWSCIKTHDKRKSFYRDDWWNWDDLTHLVMRVRGDGRHYNLRLHTKGWADVNWLDGNDIVLYTHGGPYWQLVRIPISRFYKVYKGRVQDKQERTSTSIISSVSITLKDSFKGPFRLEIDYIGMMRDTVTRREFEYEGYNMPEHQWYEP